MQLEENDLSMLSSVMRQAETAPAVRPAGTAPETLAWYKPGFGAKCRVMTSFGALPIEALRRRDPVKTSSGRFMEVQWVDQIRLDAKFMSLHPKANPVAIPKGALNGMTPETDILVSPGQALRMPGRTGSDTVSKAGGLIGRNGIAAKPQSGFTYYLFHCGEPVMVSIDGLWWEVSP